MSKTLSAEEQAFLSVALQIAATQYANDAKNLGAQAGTLEAPLSTTYSRMGAEFLVLVEKAKDLGILIASAKSIEIEEAPAEDVDGLD